MHPRLLCILRRSPPLSPALRNFSRSPRLHETRRPSNNVHGSTDERSPNLNEQDPDPDKPSADTDTAAGPSTLDLNSAKDRIRGWSEEKAIALRRRADDLTAAALTSLSQLGSQLNKVTGYDEIEALKRRVVEQEARISECREAARIAKKAHEEAVIQRSNSQREVNELLQRKSSWTDLDVSRFTNLVRQDHLHDQAEARTKAEAALGEERVEREFSELMQSILARYHEEQVWSDKIRSASTYGSLAALGLNLLVFLLAIMVVEPWKRRRLAQTFEKRIEELSAENRALLADGMNELGRHSEKQDQFLSQIAALAASLPAVELSASESSGDIASENPSEQTLERAGRTVDDRDVAAMVATTAVAAGFIGWVARSWFGI